VIKHSMFFVLAIVFVSSIQAENWPQWRGPNFNGTTDETNLPTEFSQTDNVVWSADLQGPGASTPVVWDDRVFISGVDSSKETWLA
jgi:outer membrane protein assembly factor BamB